MAENLRYRRSIISSQIPTISPVGTEESIRTTDALTKSLDALVGFATEVTTAAVGKQKEELKLNAEYEANTLLPVVKEAIESEFFKIEQKLQRNKPVTNEEIDDLVNLMNFQLGPLVEAELRSGKAASLSQGILAHYIPRVSELKTRNADNTIRTAKNNYLYVKLPKSIKDVDSNVMSVLNSITVDQDLNEVTDKISLVQTTIDESKRTLIGQADRFNLYSKEGKINDLIKNGIETFDNIIPNAIVDHIVYKVTDNATEALYKINKGEVGAFSKHWKTLDDETKESIKKNVAEHFQDRATAQAQVEKDYKHNVSNLLVQLQNIGLRDFNGSVIPEEKEKAEKIIEQIKQNPLSSEQLKYVNNFLQEDVPYDPKVYGDLYNLVMSNALDEDEFYAKLNTVPQEYHKGLSDAFYNKDRVAKEFDRNLKRLTGVIFEGLSPDIVAKITTKDELQIIKQATLQFTQEVLNYKKENGVNMPNFDKQNLADKILGDLQNKQELIFNRIINGKIEILSGLIRTRLRIPPSDTDTFIGNINQEYIENNNAKTFFSELESQYKNFKNINPDLKQKYVTQYIGIQNELKSYREKMSALNDSEN